MKKRLRYLYLLTVFATALTAGCATKQPGRLFSSLTFPAHKTASNRLPSQQAKPVTRLPLPGQSWETKTKAVSYEEAAPESTFLSRSFSNCGFS
tara:strand:- start:869 stop:1150 length:282 start_codon:yes stop_codon:yes gene_type:complete